jgi:hypothetical protein
MRFPKFGNKTIGVLFVLAIAQVIGWGTVGLLAVVGRQIAVDLHMDISAVFAGTSILYVAMGLWSPILAKAFVQFGARRVMIAGTMIGAPGFVVLSLSHGPLLYFAAWVMLGNGGQRHADDGRLYPTQRDRGPECEARDRRDDADDGPLQQYFLAGHVVSFGLGWLARNLSGLCRNVADGVSSALRLRVAASG